MKFNLDNYKKPVTDQTPLPEWAKSETTAALYKETMEIYTEIKNNIESKKIYQYEIEKSYSGN